MSRILSTCWVWDSASWRFSSLAYADWQDRSFITHSGKAGFYLVTRCGKIIFQLLPDVVSTAILKFIFCCIFSSWFLEMQHWARSNKSQIHFLSHVKIIKMMHLLIELQLSFETRWVTLQRVDSTSPLFRFAAFLLIPSFHSSERWDDSFWTHLERYWVCLEFGNLNGSYIEWLISL